MTRTKKRKLNKVKREERNFVDFKMVIDPALDMINVLADSLEKAQEYIRDIKLINIDKNLKEKLYRELLLINKLKMKQTKELKAILDSCKDEEGQFLGRLDIRVQNDAIAEYVMLFGNVSSKMMSLGIEVADTSVSSCRDLNKVLSVVIEELDQASEDKSILDEFKMITANYIGCSIEELNQSMDELNEAVMKTQKELYGGMVNHLNTEEGATDETEQQ